MIKHICRICHKTYRGRREFKICGFCSRTIKRKNREKRYGEDKEDNEITEGDLKMFWDKYKHPDDRNPFNLSLYIIFKCIVAMFFISILLLIIANPFISFMYYFILGFLILAIIIVIIQHFRGEPLDY